MTNSTTHKKHWLWFWGDSKLGSIVEEIRFNDFNEMKVFSSNHSAKFKDKLSYYYSNYITYRDKND